MTRQTVTQTQQQTRTTSPLSKDGILQRKCASCGQHTIVGGECGECTNRRMSLQRRSANQAEPSEVPPIVHEVLNSSGQPLDVDTRAFMKPRFGHDFSQVRVHTDTKAADSAQAIHALAYTTGRHVVFASGQYAPMTSSGRHLLAHELTHVVQQTDEIQPKSVVPEIDKYEKEAEQVADQIDAEFVTEPLHISFHSVSQPGGAHKRSIYQRNNMPIMRKEDKNAQLILSRSKPWNILPAEARKPILESFKTLDLPYYAHESADKNFETGAEQYFNELGLEEQIAYHEIYRALQKIGYWGEIAKIKHVYSGNVQGIKAIPRSYADLLENLPEDSHFCQDTKVGGSGGIKWRYLVKTGTKGLHIDLSDETIDVHLDTIAPAIGRKSDGHCSYSAIYTPAHIAKDKLGMDKVSLP